VESVIVGCGVVDEILLRLHMYCVAFIGWVLLTEPVSVTSRPWARASQPTMVAISCTSCLVSLACVDCERRRLSFAFRHGWVETWTLDGSDEEAIVVRRAMVSDDCNLMGEV